MTNGPPQQPAFYVAPFTFAGECEGVARWLVADLSAKWIGVCRDILRANPPTFRARLSGRLDHIEIKRASVESGPTLMTLFASGTIASSIGLFRGNGAADIEGLRMFVDSLRKVDLVKNAASSSHPFEAALGIAERPLAIIVVWAPPTLTDEDAELVRELGLHLCGASVIMTDPDSD